MDLSTVSSTFLDGISEDRDRTASVWTVGWSRREAWMLAVTVALLIGLKALFNPFPFSDTEYDDGAYYYQIARHVAHGDGLLTSVSLYNTGFKQLPHAVTFYPLWPLVLGTVGRFVDLRMAGHVLPELFYFVSLGLLYVLANRVAASFTTGRSILVAGPIRLNAGHAAVLLFGLNHNFFRFTSLPFTEAVAFTLLFATVLVTIKVADTPARVGTAVAAGMLAGLCYLARTQLLGLSLAVPLSLCVIGGPDRHHYRRAAAVSLATAGAIVLAWIADLSTAVEHLTAGMLVDAAAGHETAELSRYVWLVPLRSPRALFQVGIAGIRAAFAYNSPYSYLHSFGLSAYLVPLALAYVALKPSEARAALHRMTAPSALPVLATLIVGIVCIGPIHVAQGVHSGGWGFHFRHGLPYILLIVVALPYLTSRNTALHAVVLVSLVGSLAAYGPRVRWVLEERYPGVTVGVQAFASWIDGAPRAPVFLTTRPSTLAASTNGLFHGIFCDDSARDTRTYFDVVRIDYLLTIGNETHCPFFRDVQPPLVAVQSFGDGRNKITVWAPAASSPRSRAP